ncbi:MAG: hypothetical protein Q9169_001224 [Polycauliona sp. 2 TL-2023]
MIALIATRKSAVAFHNGSMDLAGEVSTSQDFKDLLEPVLAKAIGHEPQKRRRQCHDLYPHSTLVLSDYEVFRFFAMRIPVVGSLWKTLTGYEEPKIPPLHQIAQLFGAELLRLPPFADMDAESLSQAAVAIVLPAWLIGTEEACHMEEAARRTFGRVVGIEDPPSSAYTAAGYELCRTSYDAFECTGPGRIMTLEENDSGLSVATIATTPLLTWHGEVIFSAQRNLADDDEYIEWIDSFIASQKPQNIILAGSGAGQPRFLTKGQHSTVSEYLDDPQLPARHLLAFGAAQVAKDGLESHSDDCGESKDCGELRRKADAIAGPFRPPVPSIWPSVGLRHDEL